MKILIDEDGRLHIERAGVYRQQTCPYTFNGFWMGCGDWCPHFGEPTTFPFRADDRDPGAGLRQYVTLTLCHGNSFRVVEEDFTDERGEQKEESPGEDEHENQD